MMFKSLLLLAAVLTHLQLALAVFADDAWKLDYHHALLGLPQRDTTFFHRPQASSKASLLYTLTERNVLGAVNPKDGSLLWRQVLGHDANATTSHLRSADGQDLVISLADGSAVAWSAQTGREIWRRDFVGAEVKDLEMLEVPHSTSPTVTRDALILSKEGHLSIVRRLNAATGKTVWEHKEDTQDTPLQVSASTTTVYLITLHSTRFRVTSLNFVTGRKTDQYTLDGGEAHVSTVSSIISVGANTASPIIAWRTDATTSALNINVIGSKAVKTFPISEIGSKDSCVISLDAPYHTTAQPYFLVQYQTPTKIWADIFHVDLKSSTVSKSATLPPSMGNGAFSTTSIDANVYFTLVTGVEVTVFSSAGKEVARWRLSAPAIAGVEESLDPVHLVTELSLKDGVISAGRCAVLLASGDWIMIRNGQVLWHRPEALAHTIATAWVTPSPDTTTVRDLEEEVHSTLVHAYAHRVKRHLRDLQRLPRFAAELPSKIMSRLSPGFVSVSEQNDPYQKLLVCVTNKGRVIALESTKGGILWNMPLPQAAILRTTPTMTLDHDALSIDFHDATVPAIHLDIKGGHEVKVGASRRQTAIKYDRTDSEVVATLNPDNGDAKTLAWRFLANSDEKIVKVVSRPAVDPVASLGKVLGDRRVLYKYINPSLLMICIQHRDRPAFSVHLLDGSSGVTLGSALHENANIEQPFAAVVAENWFAYSYTDLGSGLKSRGHRLVVGELFGSSTPDDRGTFTFNASHNARPHIVSQTYAIPEPISILDVTQTGQGITSKTLSAFLPQSQALVGIPRMLVDPRRPVGRVATQNEMVEGLVQYNAVLDFDPRWYLNHQREVTGIRNVTTSPTTFESTSLVFAYGLDIFGTRISPSGSFDILGKDFNKVQMLATVIALGIATLFIAPLVQRKQINAVWQL